MSIGEGAWDVAGEAGGDDALLAVGEEVVEQGRLPTTLLEDGPRKRSVKDWGLELTKELAPVAKLLDQLTAGGEHLQSLQKQTARLEDSSLTLSARVLAEMEKEEISYFKFAMNKSIEHQTHFQQSLLSQNIVEMFESISSKSLDDQRAIEAKDGISFEQYLRNLQNSYSDLL